MSTLIRHVALVSESQSVSFSQVSTVAAALQKQATRDFGPIWGVNATVDGFDKLESVPLDYWPVILRDDIHEPGIAGFHTDNHGQPFSLVQVDENWPLTASHEACEMLADPFGNRTVAGALPPQTPSQSPISGLERVLYLVEVCDPCEDGSFAYPVNGVQLSDFITPHYYDPNGNTGVQYSFRGNVREPHSVLEGGYVSFGNPVDNNWYQIVVNNGVVEVRELGVITVTNGQSLREMVDSRVRGARKHEYYRIKRRSILGAQSTLPMAYANSARATRLREHIIALK